MIINKSNLNQAFETLDEQTQMQKREGQRLDKLTTVRKEREVRIPLSVPCQSNQSTKESLSSDSIGYVQ